MTFCSWVWLRLLHPPTMIDNIALLSNMFRLMNDETQYKIKVFIFLSKRNLIVIQVSVMLIKLGTQ